MKLIKAGFNQIDFLVFCASIFTLSQSIKLSSKLLFISLMLGVLKAIYKKDFKWFISQKPLVTIYCFLFFYICLQGIFIDGFSIFLKFFDRAYAPYLVPLFVPIFYINVNQVKVIPKVFIAGILFTFLLIVFKSITQLELYNRDNVLQVFDLHHLYISLYILFAINYLLIRFPKNYLSQEFIFKSILLFVLGCFLVFFRSKAAIVICFFLFVYHIIIKVDWNLLKSLLALSMNFLLIIVFNNSFLELYLIALDFRIRIWNAALEVISKNIIFGFGSLNEYFQLNKVHFLQGNYDFLDSNFNAHNQYLSFLLRFGIIGLFLIIAAFFVPLLRISNFLLKEYLGFLVIIFLMFFIESVYNRHHGIVFCTIMLYYYNTMRNSDPNEIK